jgi:hypothetical protein
MKWGYFTVVLVLLIVCRLHISKFHVMFALWWTSLQLCLEKSRNLNCGKWFWKRDLLKQVEQTSTLT